MRNRLACVVFACSVTIAFSSAEPPARPRIAVGGFLPAAGGDERDAWIATAAEEMLGWHLRRHPRLAAVPTVRMYQALRELQDDPAAPPDWPRVARSLGAEFLLTATCQGSSDNASFDLVLISLAEPAAERSRRTVPAGRLGDSLDEAARWTLEQLGAPPISGTDGRLILAQPFRSSSTLEYYAKGVSAIRNDQVRDAVYYLKQALDYEAGFRPALALLAQLELRFAPAARPISSARLSLLAELARRDGDIPDRIEAELLQAMHNRSQQAMAAALQRSETALIIAFERMDSYGQIAAMTSLCDTHLAVPLTLPADGDAAARRAIERSSFRRAAEWQEAVLEELTELGDLVAQAPALNKAALIEERLGNSQDALALHQRMLAIAQRLGSRRTEAAAWLFLGQCQRRLKQWNEALDATKKCMDLVEKDGRPAVQVALADIHRSMGQPKEALALYSEAYKELSKGEHLADQLACLREIAGLQRDTGDKPKSLASLREAIDIAHALQSPDEKTLRDTLTEWERDSK